MTNPTGAAAETAERDFVIARDFDVPRALMWKTWTEAERLKQWFGPEGFDTRECTVDLVPGGIFHYCLASPEGMEMWGKFTYRQIEAPRWIECIVAFSDAQGGITRHPMNENWPREMLSTITLDEHDGGTRVTVRWAPHNETAAERATFDAGHDEMRMGWTGTFDRLAAYLKTA